MRGNGKSPKTLGYVARGMIRRKRRTPVTLLLAASPSGTKGTDPSSKDFSAVAGRILDQLSPTAWLPAAFLVGDVAIIGAYALAQGSPHDRWRAVVEWINQKPFSVVLGVLASLVLTTIVTQSFEFLAIRSLEGYWGTSWLGAQLVGLGIGIQAARRRRLTRIGRKLDQRALRSILPHLQVIFRVDPLLASAVERQIRGQDCGSIPQAKQVAAAGYIEGRNWLSLVSSKLCHRLSAVDVAAERFPAEHRMMPTRLGLALRSGEDRLSSGSKGSDLRGFVIRHLKAIDSLTLTEHDQYRNRLDMYSVLCIVSVLLAAFNGVALSPTPNAPVAIAVGALPLLILSWASYEGAVATASDYVTVLQEIDKQVSGRSS